MSKSNIGWTENTINFYTWNCNPVSPGCQNCYAMAYAERLGKQFKGAPQWRQRALDELHKIPPGESAFINSFSDTWHHKAPLDWIRHIHQYIAQRPDVVCMVLTKRIDRAAADAHLLNWPDNLWMGTSVESADYLSRIDDLRRIPTANRFISFEPLLGPLGRVNLDGVGWVITGGESGKHRRYFDKAWAGDIIRQAQALGIPCFHKQGGAFRPGQDRVIMGQTFDEFPAAFNVPAVAPEPQQMELPI